jgi:predicted transcriptional regulator
MNDSNDHTEFEGLEFDDIATRMTSEIISEYISSNQLPPDRFAAVSLSVLETISNLSRDNFVRYLKFQKITKINKQI